MIYTENTRKAMVLAFEKHKNQKDKSGLPYIHHPLHVAEGMDTEEGCIVALLHDVMEDTPTTMDDLREFGLSDSVLEALELLTHREEDDYTKYIHRIGENSLARSVKLRDLEHNMDLTRLKEITDRDLKRLEKYKQAYDYLVRM